jgi:hypothetical protein
VLDDGRDYPLRDSRDPYPLRTEPNTWRIHGPASERASSETEKIVHPVLPWDMVDNSIGHHLTYFRLFFVSGQSR